MRISFVISSQHLIPHGGIGQFANCFMEQIAVVDTVDFVMDKAPANADFLGLPKDSFVYPNKPLSYAGHTETFAFSESLNFEKMINFRDALLKSFARGIPDLIIVNSIEALPAVFSLGIHDSIPVLVYTHSEYLAGFVDYKASTFSKEFLEFNEMIFKHPGFKIGTQTVLNKKRILDVFGVDLDVHALPMPIPEVDLLKYDNSNKQEGVLFIGRFEDRKNPEEYIRVIKATGLPARVMTNETGAKKFEKRFREEGITDFTIGVGLTGKPKVDFISESKIYYNPSKLESFGFTMLEGLSQCATFVLEDYSWSSNFDGATFFKVSKKDAADKIKALYAADKTWNSNAWVNEYNKHAKRMWSAFLHSLTQDVISKQPHKLKADDFKVSSYLTNLGRSYSIEDIRTLISNKKFFHVKDERSEQLWSHSGKFNIKEDVNPLEELFG